MSYRPDYGLALLRSGVNRDFESYFYSLRLQNITAIAPEKFTTMLVVNLNGVDHALSLDFSSDDLGDILDFADPATVARVRSWVQGFHGVDTIELPQPIPFGARAALGEEQRAEKEIYVPLIVQEVFSS